MGQVRHDGNAWMVSLGMEHVTFFHSRGEAARIRIIADLEDSTVDVPGIRDQESLDIVAVNRLATVKAEVPAHWPETAKASEASDPYVEPKPTLDPAPDLRRKDLPNHFSHCCQMFCFSQVALLLVASHGPRRHVKLSCTAMLARKLGS